LALELGIDRVFTAGAYFLRNVPADSRIHAFAEKAALQHVLNKQDPTGAVILIKGSRGMAMESLLEAIDYEGNT
jgi:UDP-N-acetylmuramyl pentapeptide synthase